MFAYQKTWGLLKIMKKKTKKKLKDVGKTFLKYAKSANKNLDQVNADVTGGSVTKPKSVKRPRVKGKPRAKHVKKTRSPKTPKMPSTQGQVIVNVYTGNQSSSHQASKKKASSKKKKKKQKTKKKSSSDPIDDVLYGYNY